MIELLKKYLESLLLIHQPQSEDREAIQKWERALKFSSSIPNQTFVIIKLCKNSNLNINYQHSRLITRGLINILEVATKQKQLQCKIRVIKNHHTLAEIRPVTNNKHRRIDYSSRRLRRMVL